LHSQPLIALETPLPRNFDWFFFSFTVFSSFPARHRYTQLESGVGNAYMRNQKATPGMVHVIDACAIETLIPASAWSDRGEA
jgi:hypothetical protein